MNAVISIENQTPVVERVQDALRGSPTSSQLEALHAEATDLLRGMQEAEADCRAQSLSPVNTVAEARAARQTAEDFAHESLRLRAAIVTIDEILPMVKAAEHRAAILPAYEAHKAKRAALVERIRKEWPALTAKMIDLLEAIEAFRQTPAVEIPEGEDPLRVDIEAEARGCDSSFYVAPYQGAGVQLVPRFRDARIPAFEPLSREDGRYAWPRYSNRSFA